MSLLFNMLSRLVITLLPRSKHLLISWLQSQSAEILEPKKIKSDIVSAVSPSICHEVMGLDAMILVFWMLSFEPTFSLSSLTFIKRLFNSSSLSAIRVVSSAFLRLWIRDTKGTFHAKMGSIKDRNDMDLIEAEDIKQRWQEYTEELYKNIFTTQITTMVWSLT